MGRFFMLVWMVWVAALGVVPLHAQVGVTESATVIAVIDGDTLRVQLNGKRESVRLIGVDTPEARRNTKLMNDVYRSKQDVNSVLRLGAQATDYVNGLVRRGDGVVLEYDTRRKDPYRRILAYVYLKNGTMLNEQLIKGGHATPMAIPPNTRYADRFAQAHQHRQRDAR